EHQPGSPLLADMFWTLAALPGALLALRGRYGTLMLVVIVASATATIFYLSFRASGAGAIRFGTLHYFKMWWPVAAILAAGALASAAELPRRSEKSPNSVA